MNVLMLLIQYSFSLRDLSFSSTGALLAEETMLNCFSTYLKTTDGGGTLIKPFLIIKMESRMCLYLLLMGKHRILICSERISENTI